MRPVATPNNIEISKSSQDYVPCLFLPSLSGSSNKLVIFFHGNGEDLGTNYSFTDRLRTEIQASVLAVEYPNYGVYEDPDGASEEKILRDAETVYHFV